MGERISAIRYITEKGRSIYLSIRSDDHNPKLVLFDIEFLSQRLSIATNASQNYEDKSGITTQAYMEDSPEDSKKLHVGQKFGLFTIR